MLKAEFSSKENFLNIFLSNRNKIAHGENYAPERTECQSDYNIMTSIIERTQQLLLEQAAAYCGSYIDDLN